MTVILIEGMNPSIVANENTYIEPKNTQLQ